MAKVSELADAVKATEQAQREADEAADRALGALSNVVDPAAPIGGEEDFVVLGRLARRATLPQKESNPDHLELGQLHRRSTSSAAPRCPAAASTSLGLVLNSSLRWSISRSTWRRRTGSFRSSHPRWSILRRWRERDFSGKLPRTSTASTPTTCTSLEQPKYHSRRTTWMRCSMG